MEEALSNNEFDLLNLDGILITHEHTDHTSCLGIIANATNAPIYMTKVLIMVFHQEFEIDWTLRIYILLIMILVLKLRILKLRHCKFFMMLLILLAILLAK